MSAIQFDVEKPAAIRQRSFTRRLVGGPALILALAFGSSGGLAAALIISSILEY